MALLKEETIIAVCDRCGAEESFTGRTSLGFSPRYTKLPEGWGYHADGPCGSTDYYRTLDLCPACLQKERTKNDPT